MKKEALAQMDSQQNSTRTSKEKYNLFKPLKKKNRNKSTPRPLL